MQCRAILAIVTLSLFPFCSTGSDGRQTRFLSPSSSG